MNQHKMPVLSFWPRLFLDTLASVAMIIVGMAGLYLFSLSDFWPSLDNPGGGQHSDIRNLIENDHWLILLAGTVILTYYQQARRRRLSAPQ